MAIEAKELTVFKTFTDQMKGEEITEVEEIEKSILPSLKTDCFEILKSTNWTIDTIAANGDEIAFKFLPGVRRVYRIKGTVDTSAEKLINFLYDEIESSSTWNKHVQETNIIRKIDDDTDLVYTSAKSYGNGFIGARDFVLLRHRDKHESYNIINYMSVNLKSVPVRENYVRGEHGVSFQAARNLNEEKNQCEFIFIMNTDMKGWIPRKVVDMCKSIGMADFMKALRAQVATFED